MSQSERENFILGFKGKHGFLVNYLVKSINQVSYGNNPFDYGYLPVINVIYQGVIYELPSLVV